MRLRDLPHLVHRFLGSLRPAPATPSEQIDVAGLLGTAEAHVFWSQPRADVRHALDSLQRLRAAGTPSTALQRAILLHDVGKRHSGLGVLGRSIASGLALLHIPRPARLQRYLEHGARGAHELQQLGVEPVVVAFARHHHTERPEGIPVADWEALLRADAE